MAEPAFESEFHVTAVDASPEVYDRDVKDLVSQATEFAQASPEPDPAELYTDVLVPTESIRA